MKIDWPYCVRPIQTADLLRGEVTVGYRFEGELKSVKRHSDDKRPKSFARPAAVPQPDPLQPQPPEPATQLAFAL